MNGQEIVDAIVSQGGFDTTDGVSRADVAGWAAAAYTDLVVKSRWRRGRVAFGPSVANQDTYALADTVVEIDYLRVDGQRYMPVGEDQLWDLQNGDDVLTSGAGVFAPGFDDAGVAQVVVFPAPTQDGLSIEGMCALTPVAFQDDAGFSLITPADYEQPLVERAVTLGKRLEDEVDQDPGDQVWAGVIAGLRARRFARVGRSVRRLTVFRRPG